MEELDKVKDLEIKNSDSWIWIHSWFTAKI